MQGSNSLNKLQLDATQAAIVAAISAGGGSKITSLNTAANASATFALPNATAAAVGAVVITNSAMIAGIYNPFLSITGKGSIDSFAFCCAVNEVRTAGLKVTLDGTVIFSRTIGPTTVQYQGVTLLGYLQSGAGIQILPQLGAAEFETSFLVEIMPAAATDALAGKWNIYYNSTQRA